MCVVIHPSEMLGFWLKKQVWNLLSLQSDMIMLVELSIWYALDLIHKIPLWVRRTRT